MLTFTNLKLPHDWRLCDKKNLIFQKDKLYEISSTDIDLVEDLAFIIHMFY